MLCPFYCWVLSGFLLSCHCSIMTPRIMEEQIPKNQRQHDYPSERSESRYRLFEILFESDDAVSKAFDIVLIVAILVSVLVVMLESVTSIADRHGNVLRVAEWFFTILFTLEYGFRIYSAKNAAKYTHSVFGIIDLVSIIPTYLTIFLPGAQTFAIVRIFRVLRVFRILKLVKYMSEAQTLSIAIRASRRKVTVFLVLVICLCAILGSVMYIVEGEEAGFTSIPMSVYWAIVTLTTVGYGDISPLTPLGRAIASVIMITGYSIIAVPTGIVTTELARAGLMRDENSCDECGESDHMTQAQYCHRCGNWIHHES